MQERQKKKTEESEKEIRNLREQTIELKDLLSKKDNTKETEKEIRSLREQINELKDLLSKRDNTKTSNNDNNKSGQNPGTTNTGSKPPPQPVRVTKVLNRGIMQKGWQYYGRVAF